MIYRYDSLPRKVFTPTPSRHPGTSGSVCTNGLATCLARIISGKLQRNIPSPKSKLVHVCRYIHTHLCIMHVRSYTYTGLCRSIYWLVRVAWSLGGGECRQFFGRTPGTQSIDHRSTLYGGGRRGGRGGPVGVSAVCSGAIC